MRNVTLKLNGTKLLIECDLSAERVPSSTGKTFIVASTEGNAAVPGTDMKLGLNIYTKSAQE